MKTVPLNDDSGSIPLRASKNPVLGVFRHHCGELASVHQPKGRRSGTRYLICDNCGTDQCGGKDYQDKIRANTYHSIEALQTAENAVHTVKLEQEITAPVLTEKISDEQPPQAAPHAVDTVNSSLDIAAPVALDSLPDKQADNEPLEKPVQASSKAVHTANTIPPAVEPKLNNQQHQTPVDSAKPMRVGFAAILGGVIGALIAVAA